MRWLQGEQFVQSLHRDTESSRAPPVDRLRSLKWQVAASLLVAGVVVGLLMGGVPPRYNRPHVWLAFPLCGPSSRIEPVIFFHPVPAKCALCWRGFLRPSLLTVQSTCPYLYPEHHLFGGLGVVSMRAPSTTVLQQIALQLDYPQQTFPAGILHAKMRYNRQGRKANVGAGTATATEPTREHKQYATQGPTTYLCT